MKFIITTPSGLNLLHDSFFYCGNGMWSSQPSDAVEYPTKRAAEEAVENSSYRHTLTIEELPDETIN